MARALKQLRRRIYARLRSGPLGWGGVSFEAEMRWGLLDGEFIQFGERGDVEESGTFVRGARHGVWTQWDHGRPSYSAVFERGRLL